MGGKPESPHGSRGLSVRIASTLQRTSRQEMSKKIAESGFSDWSPERLPDLRGKIYLITGGNSGIGFEAAKMLGEANADIVIASRNIEKARNAASEISAVSRNQAKLVRLDLSDLSSVQAAAAEIRERYQKLDGLINNAGIMQTPQTKTVDGFELQLATNHLGHFLFAGLLFDLVENAEGRIVVVCSIAHKYGQMNFDDLMLTRNYTPSVAYFQSKLANLMFALELDRRLKAKRSTVTCIACHPGYSATHLQSTGPAGFLNLLYKPMNLILAQSARSGAIPTVLAAAGNEALPGAYYGPQSMGESRGRISDATVAERALDKYAAARLWSESERLVGYDWSSLR